ncbi:adenylyl-sulfate kinase [Streptacidiphilus pinicola]|uniref:Adenylyl-sulfate kinase n=1 Tax=Streptacidiphilus pinicola TaxID=2219663 RepID=A0A2X0IMI5_9ACTN|nr:adenylyl-sulfate kinase [Streptacidiphilus pinicola]RAG86344.1 adenylyl-sulfate kinase [Streptacidiphilus pinicola]
MITWLIGMSGAGKTTIGTRVASRLKEQRPQTVYLDGDILREVWGDAPGHSVPGRALNAHRISHLCAMLDRQGLDVVAAVLSIFPEWQAWNREHFSSYYEVFLDVPLDTLRERDTKGLYAAALRGETENVVGVDIPFPRPAHPDLVLDSSGAAGDADHLADLIVAQLHEFGRR